MRPWVSEVLGALLTVCALGALALVVVHLGDGDHIAAALMVTVGLFLLNAGVELLRPSVGE